MKRRRKQNLTSTVSDAAPSASELPTFLDHVHELRRRLFWVVAVIIVASSAAYPYLDTVIKVLTAPLGGQQLYYLTPVGGLSFSIKICVYIGVIAAVPVIMYHLYRFLEPLMGKWRRSALFYVGLSSLFAFGGILFAYFLSLPGALHFLTGLNLNHIQAMLTVDSYLTFVMTYLLAAALLFQIPLLLLIINTMTPLKPQKLMKAQRYVIVGAFIVAAIISPTPDMMNQFIFALPIIAMYEIGVVLVWLQNKRHARRQARLARVQPQQAVRPAVSVVPTPQATYSAAPVIAPQPQQKPIAAHMRPVSMDMVVSRPPARTLAIPHVAALTKAKSQPKPPVYSDIVRPARASAAAPLARPAVPRPQPVQPASRVAPRKLQVPQRSIDGFMPYRPPLASSS